eukprot:COSAG04_NODE_499_length_13372_cov_8.292398_2_plen_126_part_00
MEAAEDGREAPPPIAPEAEAQPQQSQQAPASPPPVRRIFSCLAPAGAGAAAAEPLVYLEPPSQPGLAFFERGAAREGPGTVTVQWTTTVRSPLRHTRHIAAASRAARLALQQHAAQKVALADRGC